MSEPMVVGWGVLIFTVVGLISMFTVYAMCDWKLWWFKDVA